ncbi:MAG: glutaredoxin [Candidatus Marinimicrobia bacterium]|nr:glutaredoxin [Candidatus Neomarinimicrobiota bacterium]|tara:strand:- start:58 stop:309 length:252 start_codon:yes stop_codon:yes gene_type:complete
MVKIYTSNWCGYCDAAKKLLNKLNIQYEEINIEEINMSRKDLLNLAGQYTVPQISINNSFIGGYQELQVLYQNNKLEELINDQ